EEKSSPEDLKPSPEDLKPSPKDLKPSPEDLKPSPEDLKPSPKDLKPSPKDLKPSWEDLKPSWEDLKPSPEDFQVFYSALRAPGVALGEHRAGHELDLVEDHDGQHDGPDARGASRKEHLRHGHPARQGLLRAAEDQ